jgi:hypothetical protein
MVLGQEEDDVDATREQKTEESFPPARQRPILHSDWPPQFPGLEAVVRFRRGSCVYSSTTHMLYNTEAEAYMYMHVYHSCV